MRRGKYKQSNTLGIRSAKPSMCGKHIKLRTTDNLQNQTKVMKNMKIKNLAILAGAVLASTVAVQQAEAGIILEGTGIIATTTAPATDNISVQYTVSTAVVAGFTQYIYDYIIVNPLSDTDYIDTFAVSFNTQAGNVLNNTESYIPSSATGGVISLGYPSVQPGGITWSLGVLEPGNDSGDLEFKSYIPPTLGPANGADSAPPSPWSSLAPGGKPVAVPQIPDGGLTVACLGGSLIALQAFRRKQVRN
jgi:hypothetical protein